MKILKYLSVLKGPILFLFMYISLYSDETINIKKPDSSDFCLFRLHYENSNGEL